jgi:DNA (cytosine-5)-methyltransferase 1
VSAYYNDTDPSAVAVLKQLIVDGVIAMGDVDNRSIKDVQPHDLENYTQCHFFAGAGLWSVAARLAGWPDDRQLWTGSCPCQPFSQAGLLAGADDARHLWPDFHRLIGAGRPPVVMGEQVAGKAGRGWFNGVRADLAACGYAGRAVDFPACAVDAPHERNRLWWIAVADAEEQHRRGDQPQRRPQGRAADRRPHANGFFSASSFDVAVANGGGAAGRSLRRPGQGNGADPQRPHHQSGRPDRGSWWSGAEWIACHDGKSRRTKPGLPLLVDGMVGRVDLWRLAGNSISPVVAAEVIGAFMDTER